MDVRSGQIYRGDIDDLREVVGHDDLVEIDDADMTEKQRREQRVSLHDNRSKLGRRLVQERGYRGLTKNQRRNLRHRLKEDS